MQQELKRVIILVPWKSLKFYIPPLLYNSFAVNIAVISAIAFHFNIYQRDNKVFTTSLYKINQIINKKEEGPAKETNKKLIKYFLSIYLLGYRDAFLKVALNILPPHQAYNYKI